MATISIRLDNETKTQLDEFCHSVGLNTSTIMKMFATKVVREQRLPFAVEIDPFYSEANMAHLRGAIADVKSGKTKLTEHELIEA